MVAYNTLALACFLFVNIAVALTTMTPGPVTMIPIATDVVIAIPPTPDAPTGSVEAFDIATVIATTIVMESTPASVSPPCSTKASDIATVIDTTVFLASTPVSMSPPLSMGDLVTVEPTSTTNYTLSESIDFSPSATGFRIRTTTTAATVEPTRKTSTVIVTRIFSRSSTTGSATALPSFANEAGKIGGASFLSLLIALELLLLVN